MIDLTTATCATCPCWREDGPNASGVGSCGSCEFDPPRDDVFPATFSYTSCMRHPVHRALYELSVEAAKDRARKEGGDGQ